jgi:hypothetical protein
METEVGIEDSSDNEVADNMSLSTSSRKPHITRVVIG